MECEPIARDEIDSVATPTDTVPWPSGVVLKLSMKLTVPVGVPTIEEIVAASFSSFDFEADD